MAVPIGTVTRNRVLNLAVCTMYSSTTAVRVCTCIPRVRSTTAVCTHAAYMYKVLNLVAADIFKKYQPRADTALFYYIAA